MSWKEQKQEIIDYIESNQPEIYWDYRDELSIEQIQKYLKGEDHEVECEIFDSIEDYIIEYENELIEKVAIEFKGVDEENEDEFREFCQDYILVDLNTRELIRKTGEQVFFYDTGLYMHGYGERDSVYKNDVRRIKKKLGITTKGYDETILLMILQASYGGQLVVYFTSSLLDLINEDKHPSMSFSDMNIAIINTSNGSGDHCFVKGDFIAPFDREKLFLDKAIKYNYTYNVCGLSSDWCDSTYWEYSNIKVRKNNTKSTIQLINEYDAKCDNVFKEGKCTFGDMDFKRHRDVFYRNEYPCGHKCPHCGTFWID